MTKYITEEVELNEDTLLKLEELAKENNATLNEVINEILIRFISKAISIEKFKEILDTNDHQKIANYYTIVDKNNQPIARVVPLR